MCIIRTRSTPVPGGGFFYDLSARSAGFFSGEAFERQERGEITVAVCVLCVFLYGAGWTDLSCGKVRNSWLLAGALVGVWLKGPDFFPAAAAVLVPAYLLFRVRMMGAGDGKLMALVAGYLGLEEGIRAIGAGMAVGAVWSLCRIWHDKSMLSRFTYLDAYIRRIILTKEISYYEGSGLWKPLISFEQLSATESRHTVPLAACLAMGTYLYLLFSCAAVVGKEFL